MYSLRALRGLLILLGMMLVAGCGGGDGDTSGTPTPVTPPTGRAVFSIVWPDRTRVIPLASNSIRLALYSGQTFVVSQLVVRPAAGGTVSVPFETLPLGALTLSAQSFPNADGTGVAQGTASVRVTVTAGQATTLNLDLNSTVDHIQIEPQSEITTDAQGRKVIRFSAGVRGPDLTLSFTARNANGDVVLTFAPQKAQWTSSDPSVATVDTGIVHAIEPTDTSTFGGQTTISVHDPETGKDTSVLLITDFSISVGA